MKRTLVKVVEASAPNYSSHRLLDIKAVCALTTLGKSQVHKLCAEGDFPPAIKLSPGRSAWLEVEVLQWIETRLAERDALVAERKAAGGGK